MRPLLLQTAKARTLCVYVRFHSIFHIIFVLSILNGPSELIGWIWDGRYVIIFIVSQSWEEKYLHPDYYRYLDEVPASQIKQVILCISDSHYLLSFSSNLEFEGYYYYPKNSLFSRKKPSRAINFIVIFSSLLYLGQSWCSLNINNLKYYMLVNIDNFHVMHNCGPGESGHDCDGTSSMFDSWFEVRHISYPMFKTPVITQVAFGIAWVCKSMKIFLERVATDLIFKVLWVHIGWSKSDELENKSNVPNIGFTSIFCFLTLSSVKSIDPYRNYFQLDTNFVRSHVLTYFGSLCSPPNFVQIS